MGQSLFSLFCPLYAAEKESVSVRMLDDQRANFLSVLQENERLKHSAHGVVEKKRLP